MMKDTMPDAHNGALPSCVLSADCVRLLDELSEGTFQDDLLLFEGTVQDRQLLMQLRTHVPDCPICTAALAEERVLRSRQRQMLHQLLARAEQEVPSTTTQIMLAVRREQRVPQKELVGLNGHTVRGEIEALSTQPLTGIQHVIARRPRILLRSVLALVAALAIILTSASFFARTIPVQLSSGGSSNSIGVSKHAPDPVIHSPDWSSFVMTELSAGQKTVLNTDPVTGKSALLASSQSPENITLDGISHDGYKLLYHIFDGGSTRYYIQPASGSDALYTLKGEGSRAIWSTDDQYIFLSTPVGIERIDATKRTATLALAFPRAVDLRYYRNGYLYFAESKNNGAATILSRVNLANSDVAPVVAGLCALNYAFWLSPDGATVYYRCQNHTDLYAVNSDGTNAHSLRSNVGDVIGYAAQGELLTLLKAGSTYEVIQLGADAQRDLVIFTDVAPGAVQLTADTVAVVPYGRSLVALAQYADGSSKIWYDDLVNNQQHIVRANIDERSAATMQFAGWSRLRVPGATPIPAPASTIEVVPPKAISP